MPIYHLSLSGSLHVGEATGIDRESALEWMPSDSLFAAIVQAWVQEGVDVAARLEAFGADAPPFRLTSAFPWAGGVRFFPAPARLQVPGLEGKRAKRVRWVSGRVLEALIAGQPPQIEDELFLHGGTVWVASDETAALAPYQDEDGQVRLWRESIVARIAVDRQSGAANLFHAGRLSFAAGSGLWCAARGPQSAWVGQALQSLSDTGLGGLRSTGHGGFTFREMPDDLPPSPTSGPGMTLSRYTPHGEEEVRTVLQDERSAYRLATVGGWCTDDSGHPWRRRAVRLLAEGALLPEVSLARGWLVDVRPEDIPAFRERAVYRYALPFFLPAGQLIQEAGA